MKWRGQAWCSLRRPDGDVVRDSLRSIMAPCDKRPNKKVIPPAHFVSYVCPDSSHCVCKFLCQYNFTSKRGLNEAADVCAEDITVRWNRNTSQCQRLLAFVFSVRCCSDQRLQRVACHEIVFESVDQKPRIFHLSHSLLRWCARCC